MLFRIMSTISREIPTYFNEIWISLKNFHTSIYAITRSIAEGGAHFDKNAIAVVACAKNKK